MQKLLGLGLIAATALAVASGAQAADAKDIRGKWSTWGCNTHWSEISDGTYARYTTVQKLPDNLVFKLPAEIVAEDGKLNVGYTYRGIDHKYVYDVENKDKMMLDQLVMNGNVVFDRSQSNSPYKDRPTLRCAPSA